MKKLPRQSLHGRGHNLGITITEQTAIMVIGVHTLTQPGWSHILIERHSPGYIWEDLLFKNY